MEFLKLYIISFGSLIALDFIWLVKVAPNLYKQNIGHLMADKPNLLAAGMFYIIYLAGAVYFVLLPAVEKNSLSMAIFRGLFFGFVAYSTFDLTSMAVFRDWPVKITIIDLIWGSVLTASVSGLTFWLYNEFF